MKLTYSSKRFSSDAGISLKLSKRILDKLYEKELGAEDLTYAIWRLRDFVMKTAEMAKLLEKQDDTVIDQVINDIIIEKNRYAMPHDVCCAETPEAFSEALRAAENAVKRIERKEKAHSWFFTSLDFKDKEFKEGDTVTIQILRAGKWKHPMYGEVVVDKTVIEDVVNNFEEDVRKIELAVDENHEDNHKALGWFREVYSEDDGESCFAKIELTKRGAELLNEGAYKYFSPEIIFAKEDEETGEQQRNLLIGGAFTNRPFFKAMKPLMASENATNGASAKDPATGQFLFVSIPDRMQKFLELLAKFKEAAKVSKDDVAQLRQAYSEVPADHHNAGFDEGVEEVAKKTEGGDGTVVKTPEEIAAEEKAAADKKAADDAAAAAAAGGGEGAPATGEGAADDGVKANEDGSVTLSAAKFAEFQRAEAAKKFGEVCSNIDPFVFSEQNPKGIILPKDKQAFAEFACTLSEKDMTAVLGFLGKFRAVGGEAGRTGTLPAGQKVQLTESDEMVKRYMNEFGQNKDQAIQSATRFYELEAARK